MMTRRSCLFLLGGAAAAQIVTPRIGYIVDRENCLRAIEGVAGAFSMSAILERDVLSAAFSGASLVVKTAHELRIDDQTFDAPDGPAAVMFNDLGHVVEVFFPVARLLWTWQDGKFTAVPAFDVVADVYIRNGELIVRGVPIRLATEAREVSQLGREWLVVYADDRLYAVRGRQIYELPEGDTE
jgi:hypothetical protein